MNYEGERYRYLLSITDRLLEGAAEVLHPARLHRDDRMTAEGKNERPSYWRGADRGCTNRPQ